MSARQFGPGESFDWDSATVKVTVPVHHTATTEMREVSLPLESFARLILTSVPGEWFAEPPVSSDLPLFVPYPPVDEVEAGVRAGLRRDDDIWRDVHEAAGRAIRSEDDPTQTDQPV